MEFVQKELTITRRNDYDEHVDYNDDDNDDNDDDGDNQHDNGFVSNEAMSMSFSILWLWTHMVTAVGVVVW